MPFGIDESREYGLLDIWFSKKRAARYKKVVDFCLDTATVGSAAAIGAVAFSSVKEGVCEYGARKISRVACVAFLTPGAAASVGSVMMVCSTAGTATKMWRTGSFLWNVGITTVKGVAQGATLPQQAISLLFCGRPYTPLVHNQTLVNSNNVTAIEEGIKEGLQLVNATTLKEIAREAAKEAFDSATH